MGGGASVKGAEANEDDDDECDDDDAVDAKGRPGKGKWLLAAESSEAMKEWMDALLFWSEEKQKRGAY